MSKSTYKPIIGRAPWHVVPDQRTHGENLVVEDRDHKVICRTPSPMAEVDRVHATMIAAVPELIEALQNMLGVFAAQSTTDGTKDGPVDWTAGGKAVQAAREALAKADGGGVWASPQTVIVGDARWPHVPTSVLGRNITPDNMRRINNECRVALALADGAIKMGLEVCMDYGESAHEPWTRDLVVFREQLHACDEELLLLGQRQENGKVKQVGWFQLIYGNADDGTEVVADWGMNEFTNALEKEVLDPLLQRMEQEG